MIWVNHHVAGSTITSESSVYCSGRNGCELASITADDMIVCDGSYGCREADIDLGSDTAFKCTGSYGCQDSTITRQRGSVGSLMCDGGDSCSRSDIIYTTDIECNGVYSCSQASFQTSNGDLYCNSRYSCLSITVSAGDLNKKNPSDRSSIYVGGTYGARYANSLSAEHIYGYG